MAENEVVIVSARRTPIGSFGGALASMSAPQLGSAAIQAALEGLDLGDAGVSEVIMGNVLTAGVGQAPARQAALAAGVADSAACTTINKVCGSGLKAVMLAAQAIIAGDADTVVAGGMESMSNAPYLLDRSRAGYRLGHAQVTDSVITDGLWDPTNDFHMGRAAELCADKYNISREAQDEFAIESYKKALAAQEKGYFEDELVPVTIEGRKGPTVVSRDEEPPKAKFDKIPTLKPVFKKDGTITAANASSINDGASACVVMAKSKAQQLGLEPLARIVAQVSVAAAPEWFTTAPMAAVRAVLAKAGLGLDDIDLFEINEAFAVVAIAAQQELALDKAKLNVHGGAVALGHPIGASGARILTTLLHAMKRYDRRRGLAVLCIGGGEATAVVVQR
ncbi:hypothetical protein LCGC14_0016060 [marine sediment metagenome]|uniref:Thiolase N-terminal domain-containing protein n=1 Tax=marine sediment metagenome TaxID=412755 RepID=A0A0F9W432_9ZZZZ|nr:thiolase family protein [Phycisphaerae bacterium]HDZ42818.1 thiolase family protein [Phycisphaerae bacterium]